MPFQVSPVIGIGHSSLKYPHAGTSGGGEVSEPHDTSLVMTTLCKFDISNEVELKQLDYTRGSTL